MQPPFVLILVGLTSAGTYLVGVTRFRLRADGIRRALGSMLELVGISLLFLLLNLLTGLVLVVAGRLLARGFVSLYFTDATLVALSLLQGLMFKSWWQHSRESVSEEL